uniref:Uncharacterized protein n=1 Tax=Acrobeloides nanus TaxID=290746 RepID=A0A914CPQ5_9BILA
MENSQEVMEVEEIPMPPTPTEPTPEQTESWQKAQAALKKVGASTSQGSSAGTNPSYYNWGMVQSVYPYGQYPPMAYDYAAHQQFYSQQYVQTSRPGVRVRGENQMRQMRPRMQTANMRMPRFNQQQPQRQFRPIQLVGGTGSTDVSGVINYPETVRKYIERAYLALENQEDKPKLENYLRQRVEPLLKSGAIMAVNWDAEPLPHEVNFQLKQTWTPVSKTNESTFTPISSTAPRLGKFPKPKNKSLEKRHHDESSSGSSWLIDDRDGEASTRERSRSPLTTPEKS